jgi:hypothetical protein
MRATVMVFGFAACSFDPRVVGSGPDAAAGQDATPPDASSPEAGCTSFASQADTCNETFGGPLILDSPDFRYEYQDGVISVTDSDGDSVGTITPASRRTVNGIDLLFVNSFALGATNRLRVRGTQPLGIVSLGAITIDGDVLVESGARDAAACGTSTGAEGSNDNNGGGGGGGGGGGFQRTGSAGGDGAASGGNAGTSVTLASVVGGCAGGRGGDGDGNGGDPGVGGGAIYLAGGVSLAVGLPGSIPAAGDGGRGGAGDDNGGQAGGGGGGGSGGLIWLEASSLTIRGALGANGGSGGEGAGSGGSSSEGGDGQRGQLATTAASGASGEQEGGDGGDGGALIDATAGGSGRGGGGGGGGGGGVGFIRLAAPSRDLGGAVISPAAIP